MPAEETQFLQETNISLLIQIPPSWLWKDKLITHVPGFHLKQIRETSTHASPRKHSREEFPTPVVQPSSLPSSSNLERMQLSWTTTTETDTLPSETPTSLYTQALSLEI